MRGNIYDIQKDSLSNAGLKVELRGTIKPKTKVISTRIPK